MNWISVKKRKPKTDELVLLTNNEDPEYLWVVCGYIDRYRQWYNQFEDREWDANIHPTHWMPLPEPPKV